MGNPQVSKQTTNAVYVSIFSEVRKHKLTEFTASDVQGGWNGSDTVFRRAITDLARDGRLTKVGVRTGARGKPGIYALTEDLEKLTAPNVKEDENVSRKPRKRPVTADPDLGITPTVTGDFPTVRIEDNAKLVGQLDEWIAVKGMHDLETLSLYLEALEKQIANMSTKLAASEQTRVFVKEWFDKLDPLVKVNAAATGKLKETLNGLLNLDGTLKVSTDIIDLEQELDRERTASSKAYNELRKKFEELQSIVEQLAKTPVDNAPVKTQKTPSSNEDAFERGYDKGFEKGYVAGLKAAASGTFIRM